MCRSSRWGRRAVFLITSRYSLDGPDSQFQINHSHLAEPFMISSVCLSFCDEPLLPQLRSENGNEVILTADWPWRKITMKSMMTMSMCIFLD
ncbi:hypothetical protein MGG_16644 [Pyricularia oryzae 70-15]|uniref:Uncharacterized protein n=1 Tax=Pyricularia oryzae (strain 70-15 / ATCC MYA-4617 / FGSC 8958) TaxID=242507 RepID=G4N177_PYRO7|nr:uncharacterized protein MGG_16644 [Pyricularia oryzae 70-15]EHA51556.1 hypothetical protein MGG_16644 [Pyricularia oryzae 70-15]